MPAAQVWRWQFNPWNRCKGGRRKLMPEKSPLAYMHTCHIHSQYILSCTHRIILIFKTKRRKKKRENELSASIALSASECSYWHVFSARTDKPFLPSFQVFLLDILHRDKGSDSYTGLEDAEVNIGLSVIGK